MKLEGYLFIPYQGQLRFRYDSSTDLVFHKSDGAYDHALGVNALTGSRPITCTELVSKVQSKQGEIKEMIRPAFEWMIPQFRKGEVGRVIKMDLGDATTQLIKDTRVKVTLSVLLVDK